MHARPMWRTLRLACLATLTSTALAACHNPNRGLALPRQSGPVPVNAPRQPTSAEQAFWEQLAPARVIYIGETHNSNSDHEYQWDVLRGLRSRGVRYTVGWEMFEVPQQGLLDDWAAHRLTTEALLQKTEFESHWGSLSVLYEKILRWSGAEGVPSLALNAPAALSHKLATAQPLDAADKAMLPAGFKPLPGGYEHFAEQMAANPHGGSDLHNLYVAQLLWEQTMAMRIVEFINTHPNTKLVVLIGRGHVESPFGVPAFVMQKSDVVQLVVYPGGLPAGANAGGGHLAAKWRSLWPRI